MSQRSLAEDVAAPTDAQRPVAEPPLNPVPGTKPPSARQDPIPDARTTGQAASIDETGEYETPGNAVTYIIGLTNRCDKRLKCKIYTYVVGAKGASFG